MLCSLPSNHNYIIPWIGIVRRWNFNWASISNSFQVAVWSCIWVLAYHKKLNDTWCLAPQSVIRGSIKLKPVEIYFSFLPNLIFVWQIFTCCVLKVVPVFGTSNAECDTSFKKIGNQVQYNFGSLQDNIQINSDVVILS